MLLVLSFGLLILFYLFLRRRLNYWTRKGVRQKSVLSLLFRMVKGLLQVDVLAEYIRKIYNEFPNDRYTAMYQLGRPVLLVRDPELIKHVAVRDFDHFVNHSDYITEEMEPLWGKNLFALKGDKWRDMRATLSPFFTSSKMKAMFMLMNECAEQLVEFFKRTPQELQDVDMKDVMTRYANDVIATSAFGITCDSLSNRDNEFYTMGKDATNFLGFWRIMRLLLMFIMPPIAKIFQIKMFSLKVREFFTRLVKTNIQSRETNGIVRPDMIHLLMQAKNGRLKHEEQYDSTDAGLIIGESSSIGKPEKRQLTDEDLTAQALIFFFAGFASVSSLLCFLIYEVALNVEIQEALRKEIDETLEANGGCLTYESLLKMKYMDMVVLETLRKWPTAMVTDRLCIKPYTIEPEREGEVPVRIEKNDLLWFPIYGIHRDPNFYPDPERFDPERFSDENKANINPYTYIPFGVGPRSCIGNRFALLETKTILFHILANFELLITEKSPVPLKLARDPFTLSSENGFWFGLKLRGT